MWFTPVELPLRNYIVIIYYIYIYKSTKNKNENESLPVEIMTKSIDGRDGKSAGTIFKHNSIYHMMSTMHLWECKDNNLKVTFEGEILEIKRS
jgi:hypothetical protein